MQLVAQLSRATWRPVEPLSGVADDQRAFWVSMLLPGIAQAFHAQVLSRSLTSIRKYRAEAKAALALDPELGVALTETVRELSPADGLLMARLRGPCQLPFWSKLAIAQYRKNGCSILELSEAFACSPRTIVNVLGKSSFISPERRLTRSQLNPPNKFARPMNIGYQIA